MEPVHPDCTRSPLTTFPKIITDELATTVVILGSGTEKSIDNLSERFGLNGACRHALSRLGKPGKAGSNLIALFRTGSGMSQLVLSLTIGPQSLWAFSTTTEDVAIRNNLYRAWGASETLRAAGRAFSWAVRPRPKWNAAGARSKTRATPMGKSSTSFWKLPTK